MIQLMAMMKNWILLSKKKTDRQARKVFTGKKGEIKLIKEDTSPIADIKFESKFMSGIKSIKNAATPTIKSINNSSII